MEPSKKPRKKTPSKVRPTAKKKNEVTSKYRTMTPKEYAELRDVSLQAVCKPLRKGRLDSETLKGVRKFVKFGRFYLLTVDIDMATPLHKRAEMLAAKSAK